MFWSKKEGKKPYAEKGVDIEKGSLLCPKCSVVMNKMVYKDVVMDVCPKCNSVFLDEGELEKIEWYDKSLLTKA